MTRLEILKNSLVKKKELFNKRLLEHFNSVKQANGQPLNDKRCGASIMRKWDKQSDSLRALKDSIKKTETAIEIEEGKIKGVEDSMYSIPPIFFKLVDDGKLVQWRKHPNTFFVVGVNKARFTWHKKKKSLYAKYMKSITGKEQLELFKAIGNEILSGL